MESKRRKLHYLQLLTFLISALFSSLLRFRMLLRPRQKRRRGNLITQLYIYGSACRPHYPVTKTELFEIALQPEEFQNAGLAF